MRRLPPELLTNRRGRRAFAVVLPEEPVAAPPLPEPPPPNGEWSDYAVECWQRFWASPVARAVDASSDWPLLTKWLAMEDEHHRLAGAVQRSPVVRNAEGELVPNPVMGRLHHLDRQLLAVYGQLGMTPMARFRLGISLAELKRLTAATVDTPPPEVDNGAADDVIDLDADPGEPPGPAA